MIVGLRLVAPNPNDETRMTNQRPTTPNTNDQTAAVILRRWSFGTGDSGFIGHSDFPIRHSRTSHPHHRVRPCQAAAEGDHDGDIPLLELAGPDGLIQGDGDAGGAGVAVAVDVDESLLRREA